MASLTEFLVQMTVDPSLLERFYEDPDGAMSDAALSEEEQEILMSQDLERLKAAIDADELENLLLDLVAFWR